MAEFYTPLNLLLRFFLIYCNQENVLLKTFHNRVPVLVSAPDTFVHKTFTDIGIRVDHVPPVYDDRVFLSGQLLKYDRVQGPVLVMTGKDHDRIGILQGFLDKGNNRNTGIVRHIGIVDGDNRTLMNKEIAVRFGRSISSIIRI